MGWQSARRHWHLSPFDRSGRNAQAMGSNQILILHNTNYAAEGRILAGLEPALVSHVGYSLGAWLGLE
jgi:hypothetical protein